jgi:type III restriction enzyme
MELEGFHGKPDIAAVVAKTSELVTQQTIDIPRILVVPKGEVKTGFKPFTLMLNTLKYPAVSDELWIQHLRTNQLRCWPWERAASKRRGWKITWSAAWWISMIFPTTIMPICSTIWPAGRAHFQTYLVRRRYARKVLRCYQRDIARFVHSQMQAHYWEESTSAMR